MSQNPYESPRGPSRSAHRNYSGVRLVLWTLLFFLGVPLIDLLLMSLSTGLPPLKPYQAESLAVYVGLTLTIILALCFIPRSRNANRE